MATYIEDDDPLVSCPYNPAHRQKKSRLQLHLTKCRKHYPEENLKTCPYNAQHRVPEGEEKHHLMNCPDRSIIDKHLTKKEGTHKGRTAVPSYSRDPQPVIAAENWDDELVACGYEPKIKMKGKICNDAIRYMTPSEKKKYYEQLKLPMEDSDEEKKEDKITNEYTVKEFRQPLRQPEALTILRKDDQKFISQIGLGRGMPLPTRRIAASIFGPSNVGSEQQADISKLSAEFNKMNVGNKLNSSFSSNDDSLQKFDLLGTNHVLGIGRGISKGIFDDR